MHLLHFQLYALQLDNNANCSLQLNFKTLKNYSIAWTQSNKDKQAWIQMCCNMAILLVFSDCCLGINYKKQRDPKMCEVCNRDIQEWACCCFRQWRLCDVETKQVVWRGRGDWGLRVGGCICFLVVGCTHNIFRRSQFCENKVVHDDDG